MASGSVCSQASYSQPSQNVIMNLQRAWDWQPEACSCMPVRGLLMQSRAPPGSAASICHCAHAAHAVLCMCSPADERHMCTHVRGSIARYMRLNRQCQLAQHCAADDPEPRLELSIIACGLHAMHPGCHSACTQPCRCVSSRNSRRGAQQSIWVSRIERHEGRHRVGMSRTQGMLGAERCSGEVDRRRRCMCMSGSVASMLQRGLPSHMHWQASSTQGIKGLISGGCAANEATVLRL